MFIVLNSQNQVVSAGLYGKPKTARMQLNDRYVTSQTQKNIIYKIYKIYIKLYKKADIWGSEVNLIWHLSTCFLVSCNNKNQFLAEH